MMGKQQRKAFPQESTNRAKAPLELVHADLCSKMSTQVLGGSSYFLLIIDDYSSKMWAYFLHEKNQLLVNLKNGYSLLKMKLEKE